MHAELARFSIWLGRFSLYVEIGKRLRKEREKTVIKNGNRWEALSFRVLEGTSVGILVSGDPSFLLVLCTYDQYYCLVCVAAVSVFVVFFMLMLLCILFFFLCLYVSTVSHGKILVSVFIPSLFLSQNFVQLLLMNDG